MGACPLHVLLKINARKEKTGSILHNIQVGKNGLLKN
jgi:hypothetical protein